LFLNYPEEFSKVLHFLPEYGRWDDLLYLFPKVLDLTDIDKVRSNYISNIPNQQYLENLQKMQHRIVKVMGSRLRLDEGNMVNGKPCSLCAKWSPTEGDSLDRRYNIFETLAKTMNLKPRTLRKRFNTPLRS